MRKVAKKKFNWKKPFEKLKRVPEKEYLFTFTKEDGSTEKVKIKESKLKKEHKEILYVEFLRHFDGIPKELQVQFLNDVSSAAKNIKNG